MAPTSSRSSRRRATRRAAGVRPSRGRRASYFIGVNRNKRGIALDLVASREGREVLFRLLEDADVLIENFKTGTLERWGMGYETCSSERFPRLVHCRVSGFGADGPLGGYPGYDAVVQAMARADERQWRGRRRAAARRRAGRRHRDRAERGDRHPDGAARARALGQGAVRRGGALRQRARLAAIRTPPTGSCRGKPPQRTGNAHPNVGPYDQFKTKTKRIFLAIGNDRQFAALLRRDRPARAAARMRASASNKRPHREPRRRCGVELEEALAAIDGEALIDAAARSRRPLRRRARTCPASLDPSAHDSPRHGRTRRRLSRRRQPGETVAHAGRRALACRRHSARRTRAVLDGGGLRRGRDRPPASNPASSARR